MSDKKVCPCIMWVLDASYHLGRATEVAGYKEWSSAKSLASLSEHLLKKEVEKCFPTKQVRDKIRSGIRFIEQEKKMDAWHALHDANRLLQRKAEEACK